MADSAPVDPVQLIAQARTYQGVRWRHQGRSREFGVDCIGLLLCATRDLGLSYHHGDTSYARLSSDATLYRELDVRMVRVHDLHAARPADVLVFCFDRNPQHVALLTAPGRIIHAYAQAKKVAECDIPSEWNKYIARVYRLKEFV